MKYISIKQLKGEKVDTILRLYFTTTCMCVLSEFITCILEPGTWSRKFKGVVIPLASGNFKYCSYNSWCTGILICQAFRFQNLVEAYQLKLYEGCTDWHATCLPQRESCEVGCSSSEGAYEEEVLGKWAQTATTEKNLHHSRNPCFCKDNKPPLKSSGLLDLSMIYLSIIQ